jgi:tetratricopeptide (TPR) repeat protein
MAGDVPGAVETVRTLASRRPNDPAAARLLAQYLDRGGRQQEAVRALAAFLSRSPEADELIPILGELARESDEWGPVEAACSKMIESAPERPAARALRGEALLQLGRGKEAVEELEKSRSLAPENRLVLFQLASAYGDVGRLSEAAELLRDLARDLPDQAGVRLFLGEVLARQGDFDGALESFRAGLRAIPTDEPEAAERRDAVRRRIAAAWLGRSRADEAEAVLAGLERPDDLRSLEIRARTALRSGVASDVFALCKKIRDKGEAGLAASLEGEALASSGKLEKARAKFDEAAGLLGPEAWARAAETWRAAGRDDEAERVLRGWVRKEPESGAARFGLGAFLERSKRYDEAEAELGEAIRLEPKDSVALNYLGYSLAERGRKLDEALAFVKRALEIEPWNPAYLDSLGWVLFRMGRSEEAREPLERAARDLPRDATVLEHLGDVYEQIGERARAVSLWQRALDSGSANAGALNAKISASGER